MYRTLASASRILSLLTVLVIAYTHTSAAQTTPLPIPPTLEGPTYALTLQVGSTAFFDGQPTETYGFNGDYLGPTLILNQGEAIQMNVTNNIPDPTTVHWHGMHVSPANDGGPHTVIEVGETWQPAFTVLDKATTMWYHPHLHEKTNEHVYRGLAGLIIIRDAQEAALDLPRTYGVDDIPLIIQDRDFDANGGLVFNGAGAGAGGDVMVINGVIGPSLDAPAQIVRFRVVNGSGARVYNLGLSDNRTFYQIGSDGGLLEVPLALDRVRLAPGERAELLVDLSNDNGTTVRLMSYASELTNGEPGGAGGGPGQNALDGADFDLLTINVGTPTADAVTTIPTALVPSERIDESEATVVRPMVLGGGGPGEPFTINGATMDHDIINEVVELGTTEIWEISNTTNTPHPFHIHDIQFYILDRNGAAPPANEQGRKDVVLVYPNETVRFIGRFEDFADDTIPYMYHCHFLGHEDGGMMGQFLVRNVSGTSIETTATLPTNAPTITNYPNPFEHRTTIAYTLAEPQAVQLTVYNLLGQPLKTIFEGRRAAGTYETIWKAHGLASGTYFMHLTTASGTTVRPVVVARE